MIKTATEVLVPKLNPREGNELKTVYSEVCRPVIDKNGYQIPVKEWVIDTVTFINEDGEPIEKENKRFLFNGQIFTSFKTFEDIDALEALLKNDDALTNLGLASLIGLYAPKSLNDKISFVLQIGLLLQNNQDQTKDVNWVIANE